MKKLLLVSLDNRRYGIWKDEVPLMKNVPSLSRLPFAPPHIAGLSIIEERTMTLADLSVCVGHAPIERKGAKLALLKSETARLAGFVVSGEPVTIQVSPEAVFPLPEYLKSAAIDTCAIHESAPIPVINIAALFARTSVTEMEASKAALAIPAQPPLDAKKTKRFRLFVAGGNIFAAAAQLMEEKAHPAGPTAAIPRLPEYLRGVTFLGDGIVPVIDLSRRISGRKCAEDSMALSARIGKDRFSFLIDEDRGEMTAEESAIHAIPPMVRTDWMRDAVLADGRIFPLLDLGALLSCPPETGPEASPAWPYVPDSRFQAVFREEEVDVVEFSLLGIRHSLPKSEVEDIVPLRQCSPVPKAPPILMGITELGGKILPVLDLAAVFGRRSAPSSGWRMILVKNGNFRALVVSEKVFSTRKLTREMQRRLPVVPPHGVVYGCYTDAEAVRLILNVEALSAHFEKSLVKEFMPSISAEFNWPEQEKAIPQPGVEWEAQLEFEAIAEIGESAAVEDETFVSQQDEAETETAEIGSFEDVAAAVKPEIRELEIAASEAAPAEEGAQEVPVPEFLEMPDEAPTETEEPVFFEESGSLTQPAESPLELDEPLPPPQEVEPTREFALESEEPIVEAAFPEQTEAGSIRRESEEITSSPIQSGGIERSEAPEVTEDMGTKKTAAFSTSTMVSESWERTEASRPTQKSPPIKRKKPAGNRKRAFLFVAIAVLFFAAIGSAWIFIFSKVEKPIQTITPIAAQPVEPETPVKPQLELDIPKEMPVESDVYEVVEGDTLWSISERFTGNPYNYPRIAGENRIADPDLIFPGQRIRLYKK